MSRGRSFVTYLELRVELFKTHTVEIGGGDAIHMFMVMAGIRKTNQEGEADSRAKNALASERHGDYICPLEFPTDLMIQSVQERSTRQKKTRQKSVRPCR
jgi:hypothetical protein